MNLFKQAVPVLLLTIFVFSVISCATPIAQDEGKFTAYVGESLKHKLPDFAIKPIGKLTLEGKSANGESTGELSLDRLFAFCDRDKAHCNDAVEYYVESIAETILDRNQSIEKAMVRLVLRPQKYVNKIKQQMGSGQTAIYDRPFAAGLAIVPIIDFTRATRFVNEKDLAKLGVDESGLFQLGENNLRGTLRPLADVAKVPVANSLGYIRGEDYASSRIIFHSDWAPLAEKLNQQLIVMIPTPDLVLYGDGSTPVGIVALKAFGVESARRSTRPLSTVILRWTKTGWDEVE